MIPFPNSRVFSWNKLTSSLLVLFFSRSFPVVFLSPFSPNSFPDPPAFSYGEENNGRLCPAQPTVRPLDGTPTTLWPLLFFPYGV